MKNCFSNDKNERISSDKLSFLKKNKYLLVFNIIKKKVKKSLNFLKFINISYYINLIY